jgi:hypothetical protein
LLKIAADNRQLIEGVAFVANRAWAGKARPAPLTRDLEVGFDAVHPSTVLRIEAGLNAAKRPIQVEGPLGAEQRSADGGANAGESAKPRARNINVGARAPEAVAGVAADIEACPVPAGIDGRGLDRQVGRLRRRSTEQRHENSSPKH